MDIFEVNGAEGDIDSLRLVLIRTVIMSLLNIIDLVLSIISFDSDCLTFFVLKYITITFTFLMWFLTCCSYSYESSDGIDAIAYCCPASTAIIIVIGLEISVLVFFILDFKDLDLLAIISYFIHWIPLPMAIIISRIYGRCI